jgi:hypothetical protein
MECGSLLPLYASLIGIERINRAFEEGAGKLAHSKGCAADKKYAALGETPGAKPCSIWRLAAMRC